MRQIAGKMYIQRAPVLISLGASILGLSQMIALAEMQALLLCGKCAKIAVFVEKQVKK